MRFQNAKFVTSMTEVRDYEGRGLPEIAFAGKSNVGKSSLINTLAGRNGLARTSAEPGKTRLLNVYQFDETLNLIDLPGYGFAKAPKDEIVKWGAMIEGYLQRSVYLRHVFLLVDIRHDPGENDVMMLGYLRHYGKPFTVIATKCDKISKAARAKAITALCRGLAVQPWQVILTSSEDGTGRDNVISKIEEILAE